MQTFFLDSDLMINAFFLDRARLGKQRVEALQIADNLLGNPNRWSNHPAVKMWRGHERFLMQRYIPFLFNDWERRRYQNIKVLDWHKRLLVELQDGIYIGTLEQPYWLTNDFIESHRSNLIRKNPEYYKPLFPNTEEGLPYIWPVR